MIKPDQLRLIGVGYQIGVGKDSVADILCTHYGFSKMRFADPLKEAVSVIFGWPREALEDQTFKATVDEFWGITPRTALQLVGTDAMRNNVDQDVWIKSLQRRLKLLQEKPASLLPSVVVTDMRFLNEVETIKKWGGITVKIVRPDNEFTSDAAKHASELQLDDYTEWDYTIVNNGTLKDLRESTRGMLEELDFFYDDGL